MAAEGGQSKADCQLRNSLHKNTERTVPKLFEELSHRYALRQGGYTRIHKFGHRKGDHAASAILELVDGPKDLKFAITAKAVGRELCKAALKGSTDAYTWATTTTSTSSNDVINQFPAVYDLLNPITKNSVAKVLRYRGVTSPLLLEAAQQEEEEESSRQSTTSTKQDDQVDASATPVAGQILPALPAFEKLAREAFFKAIAVSKVPAWSLSKDLRSLMRETVDDESSVPITAPGSGRKIWAGQESLSGDRDAQYADDADWVDDALDSSARGKQAREKAFQQKLRHPDGRNGNVTRGLRAERSALRRAKGHQAAPRTLSERRQRLDFALL